MELPTKLPETGDFKSLYSWLNKLLEFTRSLEPKASFDSEGGHSAAGFHSGGGGGNKPRFNLPCDIRMMEVWQIPGSTVHYQSIYGSGSFVFNGLICQRSGTNYLTYGDESIAGVPINEMLAVDYNTISSFYMVELPPNFRGSPNVGPLIDGTTYENQKALASDIYISPTDSGSLPLLPPQTGVFGGIYLDEDFKMVIDPPYIPFTGVGFDPGGSTSLIYAARQDKINSPDIIFYFFINGQTFILEPGWFDLNVDARRWMPCGIVEGKQTLDVTFGTGDDAGKILDPDTGEPYEDDQSLPIDQSTNHP